MKRHNPLDYACSHWIGDMSVNPLDTRNRWFGGAEKEISERRCVVCRPFTDEEANELLDMVVLV